jgi:hypothetical protein
MWCTIGLASCPKIVGWKFAFGFHQGMFTVIWTPKNGTLSFPGLSNFKGFVSYSDVETTIPVSDPLPHPTRTPIVCIMTTQN